MSTLEKETADEVYRVYVTDSFKELLHLNVRYYDMAKSRRQVEEERTEEQIVRHISDKLNNLSRKEEQ